MDKPPLNKSWKEEEEAFLGFFSSTYDESKPELLFQERADFLMNKVYLLSGNTKYRIIECEAYHHSKGHEDPYTHNREPQLYAGRWYFNDMGLDITFGNYETDTYSSVLIRGVRNLNNDRYISGPSNVVREIFNSLGIVNSNKEALALKLNDSGLYIEETPFKTGRVGLTSKSADKENFHERPYRFLIEINERHKFSGKEKVVKQLLMSTDNAEEASRQMLGYKVKIE